MGNAWDGDAGERDVEERDAGLEIIESITFYGNDCRVLLLL